MRLLKGILYELGSLRGYLKNKIVVLITFLVFLFFTISSSFIKMNLFFNKVLFLEDKCFFH